MIEPYKVVGSAAYFAGKDFWVRLTLSVYQYSGLDSLGRDVPIAFRIDEHWSRDGNNWNHTGWTAIPAEQVDRDNFWRHKRLQLDLSRNEVT